SHAALTLAQDLAHPSSLAFALNFAARLHQFRREGWAAQERAEAAITISTQQGFPLWLAYGTIVRGWALAEQGHTAEGIAQTRQGIAGWRATKAELWRPYHLALLAEVHEKVGQGDEGLSVLTEALTTMDRIGDHFYEAELYRLKGELTLHSQA